jgi:5-methylcytosine-specific restriction endonuclease McrA
MQRLDRMSKRTTTPKKKVISKKLREEVWLKHFGKIFSSKCPIQWCTREISVFSFEVGHNIPESKGGRTTIDNLIPICGDCNRSMGDRFTIDEFSRQFAASAVPTTVPKTLFQRFFGCFIMPQQQGIQPRKKINLERKRSYVRTIYK